MLHKPKGYVVTLKDERGRKTVYDLLPAWAREEHWVPVGRLDLDSRGLLLFTRESSLVEALARPGACVKTYELTVRGRVEEGHLENIRRGVATALGPLSARSVKVTGHIGPKTRLLVDLDEGKNRHLRRLFGGLKDPQRGTPLKVLELKRTAVGGLKLDQDSGKWRFLTIEEERKLCPI
jgi:23S rRNA pseudouridine2605 synthase